MITTGMAKAAVPNSLDDYPALVSVLDNVAANPKIAKWNEAHKK